MGSYHRTLGTYLNGLVEAGFAIEWVAEPPTDGDMARRRPVWTEVPPALAVRCRKVGDQS